MSNMDISYLKKYEYKFIKEYIYIIRVDEDMNNDLDKDMDKDVNKDVNNNDNEDPNKDFTHCDNCDKLIVYDKDGYYILTKTDNELCWCQECFDKHWKKMRNNLWECDDFDNMSSENESENDDKK